MTDDHADHIGNLKRESDELDANGDDESDRVVEVNDELAGLEPAVRKWSHRRAIARQNRREYQLALEAWDFLLAHDPRDEVAKGRRRRVQDKLDLEPEF